MVRVCNRGSAGALLVGALMPLASRAHQERFWYDFRNCGFGLLGAGTTWVLWFDSFATEKIPIDVGWPGVVSFRSGH